MHGELRIIKLESGWETKQMLLPYPTDERKYLGSFNRNCRMNPRNSEGGDVLEKCGDFFKILFCFLKVVPDPGIMR